MGIVILDKIMRNHDKYDILSFQSVRPMHNTTIYARILLLAVHNS